LCQRFLSSSAVNVSGEKPATDSDHSAKDGSGQGKESGGGGEQDQKNYTGKPVRGGVCISTIVVTSNVDFVPWTFS